MFWISFVFFLALGSLEVDSRYCVCVIQCPKCKPCECNCPADPVCPNLEACSSVTCPASCPESEPCKKCDDCVCLHNFKICDICPPVKPDTDALKVGDKPRGFRRISNGWYKLHLEPQTWMQSKRACHREGSHLLIVNSPDELSAVQELFDELEVRNELLHIGFHKISGDDWLTVEGDLLKDTGYWKWEENEPDNFRSIEFCGAMSPQGLYHDVPCKVSPLNFVCEIEEI